MMSDKNPYKKGGMFENASFLLFERAKQLRNRMTKAEEMVWMHLRKGVMGYKFRRQHPISNYIVDFFCYKIKLIIEIDGSIHNNGDIKAIDQTKQTDLEKMGYTILRFTNDEVFSKLEIVVTKISDILNNIIHNKSPKTETKSPL